MAAFDMRGSLHNFRLRRETSPPNRLRRRARSTLPVQSPSQSPSASHTPSSTGSHPGRLAAPACDRCRSFKKKCSRTFPECDLCVRAGRKCSYSAPPVTPEAEALQLRARVRWLSEYINGNLLLAGNRAGGVEAIETGSDLASLLGRPPGSGEEPTQSARLQSHTQGRSGRVVSGPSESVRSHAESTCIASARSGPGQGGLNVQIDGNSPTSPPDPGSAGPRGSHVSYPSPADLVGCRSLPEDASARRFVDAYFRNINKAYPFVNQSKILESLETFSDLAQRLRDSQSTLLYLVMSIGCTTLERAGHVPRDTAMRFEVAYAEIIQECVCREGVESVQILMLLALYSLFDPAGASTYSVVGIAARQAIAIGLTRRPVDEHAYPPAEIELRHRLYWSIHSLDSMMAVAQGLPVAMTDENADVPLPSLTVEEFASAERSAHARKLQTSRHIILLRQLESRVLTQIHLRKNAEIAELTPSDRRATLGGLRASIEDWYSQGCLMSPMETDNATVHSSFTWLSARYYHLLLLLYYPNHFNSSAGGASVHQVLQFGQRQLQFTSALFQQRQLPLNCNTLYRLMPVCMVLMQGFMAACTSPSTFPTQAKNDVAVLLSILESFSEEWVLARRAAQVMHQFARAILGEKAFFADDTAYPLGADGGETAAVGGRNTAGEAGVSKESLPALVKPCVAGLVSAIRETLGQSTCFQFCEFPSGNINRTETVPPLPQPHGKYQHQLFQQHQVPFPTAGPIFGNGIETDEVQEGGVGDDQAMGYGWGALDMEFM